jgi:hypothetical protein
MSSRKSRLSPAERSQQAREAVFVSWAGEKDRSGRTASARARFEERFDTAADPEAARKAYFLRLSRLGNRARAARRADGGEQDSSGAA